MPTQRRIPFLSVAFLALSATALAPCAYTQELPLSLGFEQPTGYQGIAGWQVRGRGFQMRLDSVAPFAGTLSMRSQWVDTAQWSPGKSGAGVAMRSIPVALARGRALHLSGYIRTEGITAGEAGLWMRVDAAGRPGIAGDFMTRRGARSTMPWTRYDIELPVDSGARDVMLGVLHQGNGTAWFDSLTVEVVGPAMPRRFPDAAPATLKPETRPFEDLTRLLSDAELALPPDSMPAPVENVDWTNWVKSHARPIRSLGATDFSDLRFFAPLLRGKRIVQLGESGHGVAEFNLAKVRLVKYLHEELGYDVIAFESSLFECNRAQRAVATLNAEQLMRACLFSIWWTAEALPLFDYIKQTQATAHPLVLAGVDVQTSTSLALSRPAFFADIIGRVDAAYARRVRARDSTYLAQEPVRSDSGITDIPAGIRQWEAASVVISRDREARIAFYDSLATWMRAHELALVRAMPHDPGAPMLARQLATSQTFLTRALSGALFGQDAFNHRDRGMADNLDFLLNDLYAGKKIMVWAANVHIQHREGTNDDGGFFRDGIKTMGAWTAERHRAELYTIGLFMYRGRAASNDHKSFAVQPVVSGSLESIMHRVPSRYAYVDLSRESPSPGTSWMFTRITAMLNGSQRETMVPRDEYDGILFIDTAHPPQYLPDPSSPSRNVP